MSSSPILISNITCARRGKDLFAPISITLNDGETLILRGENGSGKSTLLRTLAGLIPSTLNTHHSSLYLGHTNAMHPSLTVHEHLDFWRGLQSSRALPNSEILLMLSLREHATKHASHLSNGLKRRLAFARLLLHPAKLWLLDEPQAALDKNALHILLNLISDHASQGGISIIASHDDLSIAGAQTLTLQAATMSTKQ